MEKYFVYVQLLLFVSISGFLISASYGIFGYLKVRREKIIIEKFTVATTESELVLLNSLDEVIKNTMDEYVFIEIENNTSFILTEDSETKITKAISNLVVENMSDIMYQGLCMIFNQEKIPVIISNRVYAKVVDYLTGKKSELEE